MFCDRYVVCGLCLETFVFSAEDQLQVLKTIPLDDLLDPPGQERSRYILQPSECQECELRLAERS